MQTITDFHTHILPGIDDGAETVDESVEMLRQLHRQGVRRVILTPHFYPQAHTLEDFLTQRKKSCDALFSRSDLPKDMEIIVAAEVYLHEAILNYSTEEIRRLCIPDSDLILVEFPYNVSLSASVLQRVYAMMYNHNCTPVLAHIDRYLKRLNKKQLDELLEEGCKLQINLGHLDKLSLMQRWQLARLIRDGNVDCCGTDCHNLSTRPPLYTEPARRICKTAGNRLGQAILTAKSLPLKTKNLL